MEFETRNSMIVARTDDGKVECQIFADDISKMKPYVETLLDWATTTWDYNAVDDWNTEEYSLVDTYEGYFKVHKPNSDDKAGLFGGLYGGSPGVLEDWEDMEIHMYVYIEISKEEYERLNGSEALEDF